MNIRILAKIRTFELSIIWILANIEHFNVQKIANIAEHSNTNVRLLVAPGTNITYDFWCQDFFLGNVWSKMNIFCYPTIFRNLLFWKSCDLSLSHCSQKELSQFRLSVLNLLETDSVMLYMLDFVISGGMIEFVFSVIYINESLFILNLYLGF